MIKKNKNNKMNKDETKQSIWNKICDMIKSLFFSEVIEEPVDKNSLFNTSAMKNNSSTYSSKSSSFSNFELTEFNTQKLDNFDIKNGVEHQKMIKSLTKNYSIQEKKNKSHEEILKIINVNIVYLEKLAKVMSKSIYVMEYEKVKQLLEQSQSCLKLLKNINQNQIFYQNTSTFVLNHALQVGKLTEHLKHINLE